MIAIPDTYKKKERIDPKTFISKELNIADRKRLRDCLVSAELTYQIAGEEMPSYIDADHNCVVIMFLDIRLRTLKDAAFVADIIQPMIKALCVIRFYDSTDEAYSFAVKRLSKQDSSQIVVADKVLSVPHPHGFPSQSSRLMDEHIAFDRIKNRADKLSFYKEMMVKAFIVSNPNLYNGIIALLDKPVWYGNTDGLFDKLTELKRLKDELEQCDLPAEKVKVNERIKKVIDKLEEIK